MKRLISILVLVAMMLTSFAATLTAIADEIVDNVEGTEPPVESTPENVYNVNWKELFENGTMRSQWAYDRASWQNNMTSKYNVTVTENALTLTAKGNGDHRQYYSDVMFDLTADTNYVYEFEVNSHSYNDGGAIFAFGANPLGKVNNDDIIGTDDKAAGDIPVAAYFLRGKLNSSNAELKFGGAWGGYGYQAEKDLAASVTGVKVVDGYAKYKVVYTGLTVEFFFLNTADEWVEIYADETITLVEGTKLAYGVYTWSPDWADVKNCVVTATNDAALAAMTAALSTEKTAYEAKLAEANALVEADWFATDWATFTKKVAAANAKVAAAKYQYQIDEALVSLDAAIATLTATAATIKPVLDTKIKVIKALEENKALYTETSWARAEAALAAAEAVYADEASTQSAMVAACAAIDLARKSLLTVELAVVNTYKINWKYLFENNMLRSQWWWDNSDGQNNYTKLFKVTATENGLYSEPIGDGDNRSYYSTNMIEITEGTYYEYTFEAKNDRAGGYAGIMFAYDKDDFPYFVYGQFDNDSDKTETKNYDSADFRYRKGHQDRTSDGHSSNLSEDRHYPILELTEEGFGQFKYVYDGYNFSFYAKTKVENEGEAEVVTEVENEVENGTVTEGETEVEAESEYELIWTYVLPEGAKIAVGVYTRGGPIAERRTISLQNAVITTYNEITSEKLLEAVVAPAIKVAEAKIAEGIYTPDTINAVKTALDKVKKITATTAAADVDAAIAELENAINALKTADKDDLIAFIDEVTTAIGEKTAEDYEERYYTPFAEALANAIAARDNLNADQPTVDNALAALKATYKYLTEKGKACLVDLDAALEAYAAIKEDDYKPNSWVSIADPLAAAQALKAREDLTSADQEALDAAAKALVDTINALVKRADFSKLNASIERAEALDKDDYTVESWNIDEALANAILVAADLNLDQEAVDAARTALNVVLDALVTWRTNVLAIKPADDYVCNSDEYGATPSWYNKITDMSYYGLGNVFYYDYYKVLADKIAEGVEGFEAGKVFPQSMKQMGIQGSADYTLRLGTNVSGGGTNRVTDGYKLRNSTDGDNLNHRALPTIINGKTYGHVFGFSFLKAPTVDSIAVYLPTNTNIASIDVYGAVRETLADGTVLYGKADKADVVADADGVQCEDSTTVKKVYLGTINVPAATAGADNILAACDFEQAMKVDYIYFAINLTEGTGKNAYYFLCEVELFGLNEGEAVDGKLAPDFAAVNAAFAAFVECVESDYTVDSWANVAAVKAQYANTINNLKAEQADVDAAAAAIAKAVADLIANPAVWTDLDALISAGSAATLEAYTPNTFNAFKALYDAAVALRASSNVPQTKVNAAVKALQAAYEALAKRADTAALKAAYDEATTLKKEEWNKNAIAWKMFENAIAAAQALLADENTTQEQADLALADLVSRRADLVAADKPVTPDTPVTPGTPDDGNTETDAPVATDTQKATESEEKATETEAPVAEEGCGGCGSSAAISAIAIVSVIGTAIAVKKKED